MQLPRHNILCNHAFISVTLFPSSQGPLINNIHTRVKSRGLNHNQVNLQRDQRPTWQMLRLSLDDGAISHKCSHIHKMLCIPISFKPPYFCFNSLYFLDSYSKGKARIQKTSPFSSSNRGTQRCNGQKSRRSKLLSVVPKQKMPLFSRTLFMNDPLPKTAKPILLVTHASLHTWL